jgi:hypothetical protein
VHLVTMPKEMGLKKYSFLLALMILSSSQAWCKTLRFEVGQVTSPTHAATPEITITSLKAQIECVLYSPVENKDIPFVLPLKGYLSDYTTAEHGPQIVFAGNGIEVTYNKSVPQWCAYEMLVTAVDQSKNIYQGTIVVAGSNKKQTPKELRSLLSDRTLNEKISNKLSTMSYMIDLEKNAVVAVPPN